VVHCIPAQIAATGTDRQLQTDLAHKVRSYIKTIYLSVKIIRGLDSNVTSDPKIKSVLELRPVLISKQQWEPQRAPDKTMVGTVRSNKNNISPPKYKYVDDYTTANSIAVVGHSNLRMSYTRSEVSVKKN